MTLAFSHLITASNGDTEIDRAGLRVYTVFGLYAMGDSAEHIAEEYGLPVAAVYEALAYAADHPEEMEAIRRAEEAVEDQLIADLPEHLRQAARRCGSTTGVSSNRRCDRLRRPVVVPLYLDDCLIARQATPQLRAAGHLVYATSELSVEGQDDELHLETATRLGAVIASQNQQDFGPLHDHWQRGGRPHAGILLTHQLPIGPRIERLERAARLLTPEIAANQLLRLDMFATEHLGTE